MLNEHEAQQQDAFLELAQHIPLTAKGLPFYLYRLDFLWQPTSTPSQDPNQLPQPEQQGHIPKFLTHDDDHDQDAQGDTNLNLNLEDFEDSDTDIWMGHRQPDEGYYQPDAEPAPEPAPDKEKHKVPAPNLDDFRKIAGYTPEQLNRARVRLFYSEGYPAMSDGRTLWSRWEWEPPEAYAAFQAYLHYNALKDRPRLLEEMVQFISHQAGVPITLEKLTYYATVYYWQWRAKAYDLFEEQAFRFQLEQRAKKSMARHYDVATDLFERLEMYLSEEKFWKQMNPKLAIDFLKKLTDMQRVASGLTANGGDVNPGTTQKAQGSSAVNVNISQNNTAQGRASGGGSPDELSLDMLSGEALKDPETAQLFQQLIIKLNRHQGEDIDLAEFEEIPDDGEGGGDVEMGEAQGSSTSEEGEYQ